LAEEHPARNVIPIAPNLCCADVAAR
jgi:hypothetical protein